MSELSLVRELSAAVPESKAPDDRIGMQHDVGGRMRFGYSIFQLEKTSA